MSELALNLLVVMAAINAVVTARTSADVRRARVAKYGAALGAWLIFAVIVVVCLWVWVALSSGHWQFIAIVAVPTLVTIGATAAKPTSPSAGQATR